MIQLILPEYPGCFPQKDKRNKEDIYISKNRIQKEIEQTNLKDRPFKIPYLNEDWILGHICTPKEIEKTIKSVLKNLNNSVSASIVLFSTVAAQRGMPFHSSISAAKGGVEGLAKSLAAEFSPKIRVNVIAPSLVNTPLANRFLNNDIKIEKSSQRHPLKRIGQPEDISNFIEYLLSEKSSWMTGQIISIDGGLSTIETN